MSAKYPDLRPDDTMDLGRYSGLGLQFAITFGLFGVLGWWLDGKLGTEPWLLIVCTFIGATVSFVWLIRQVPPPGSYQRAQEAKRRAAAGSSSPAEPGGNGHADAEQAQETRNEPPQ